MSPWNLSLALLSGLLLVLAFPRFDLEVVAWGALIPLFRSLRGTSPVQASLLGFLAGFSFFTGLLPWIYNVLNQYGHIPGPVSVVLLLLLTAYLALYFSAFAFVLRWAQTRMDLPETLLAPPLWVSLEYIRGFLFSGFPWELLGYSQYLTLPLIQISDLTGVYGVSFLIVLVNATGYRVLEASTDGNWRPVRKEVLAAGFLLALSSAYGYFRLSEWRLESREGTPLRIALIQGNIPQDVKWDSRFQEETMAIYTDLTRRARAAFPHLVIWPETATPFFFQDTFPHRSRILELAEELKTHLLFGSPGYDRKGRELRYYNSAFLISPEGKIAGRYDKIHLVPFGEFTPLRDYFPFLRNISVQMGDFFPGQSHGPIKTGDGALGVLICFEGVFPSITNETVRQGANVLVNITNDAWFGRTSAPYQHLGFYIFRAVETDRWVLRSANTGISAVIDPQGRIRARTGLFERTVLTGTFAMKDTKTFYVRHGDYFVLLAALALLTAVAYSFFRKKTFVRKGKSR